jgi:hypothetical protein
VAPTSEPKQEATAMEEKHESATAEAKHETAAADTHGTAEHTEPKVDSTSEAAYTSAPPGGTEHPEAADHKGDHPASTEAGKQEEAHTGGAESHGDTAHGVDESKSFKLGYTIPGLEEIGILIGFLSLYLFFFFNQLSKVSLVPMKDPFLEESLHHDTGTLIEGEGGGHH